MFYNGLINVFLILLHLYFKQSIRLLFYAQCAESTYANIEQQKLTQNMQCKSKCLTIVPSIRNKLSCPIRNQFTTNKKKIKNCKKIGYSFSKSYFKKHRHDKNLTKKSKTFMIDTYKQKKILVKNIKKSASYSLLKPSDNNKNKIRVEKSFSQASQFIKTRNASGIDIHGYQEGSQTPNLSLNAIRLTSNPHLHYKNKELDARKTNSEHTSNTHINSCKDQKNKSENSMQVKIIINYNMCIFTLKGGIRFLDFEMHFVVNQFLFDNFAENISHSNRVYNYHKPLFLYQQIRYTIGNLIEVLSKLHNHSDKPKIKAAIKNSSHLFHGNIKYVKLNFKCISKQMLIIEKSSIPINHDIIFVYNETITLFIILRKKLPVDMNINDLKKLILEFLIETTLFKKPTNEFYTLRPELFKLQIFLPELYLNLIWILKMLNDPLQNQKYLFNFALAECEIICNLILVFYELQLYPMHKTKNTEKLKKNVFTYRKFILKKILNLKPNTMSSTLYSYAFDQYAIVTNPNFQGLKTANLLFLLAFAPETLSFTRFFNRFFGTKEGKRMGLSFKEFFHYKLLRIISYKQEAISILYNLILFFSKLNSKDDQIIFSSPILIPYRNINVLISLSQDKNKIIVSFLKNLQLVNYLNNMLFNTILN